MGSCSACWRVRGRGLGGLEGDGPFENKGMSAVSCLVKDCKGLSFACGDLSVAIEHGLLARDLFLGDGHVLLSSEDGQ